MVEMTSDIPGLADVYRTLAWAIGPTLVALIIMLGLRLRRWQKGTRHPSDNVQRTISGQFGAQLPVEVSLLASGGTGRAAHETLGERFLRPSWGLLVITFGLPVVTFFIAQAMYSRPGIVVSEMDIGMLGLLGVLMFYAMLYIGTYELRYDSYRYAQRNWLFQYREYPWDDLLSIRDDGAYFYILRGLKGGKAYVPKHLTGIQDFVRTAQAKLAASTAT